MKLLYRLASSLVIATIVMSNVQPVQVYANGPTQRDKNWYNDYKSFYPYSPPPLAPKALGIRSLSDAGQWEYSQTLDELSAQADYLQTNAFVEIFGPKNVLNLKNLTTDEVSPSLEENEVSLTHDSSIEVLDNFEQEEYLGLTDNKINYLIQNNIITRKPKEITIGSNISIGELPALYNVKESEAEVKSEFLMGLHKSTYGTISSRPLIFRIIPYRLSQKITWEPVYVDGEIIGYNLYTHAEKLNNVADKSGYLDHIDRGEYKVQLVNKDGSVDQHASILTFPDGDKLFVTNPNIKELYIKSLLEKGIISEKNLDAEYNSKNRIISNSPTEYTDYGKVGSSGAYKFPNWAPELGAYDQRNSIAHTKADIIPNTKIWGKEFTISGNSIKMNDNVQFFANEEMTTMEALKAIEAILRQEEHDMTEREASIITYKYGADFAKLVSASDHKTVVYLTAKGILDFENFEEYSLLYQSLTKKYSYTLLYRVHNKAARKTYSQIQLTDSEAFWVDQGFVSGRIPVKTLNLNELKNMVDSNGEMTYYPNSSEVEKRSDKVSVTLEPMVKEVSASATKTSKQSLVERASPYNNNSDKISIKDNPLTSFIIVKSFPNAYEYTYRKKEIVSGKMPEKRSEFLLTEKSKIAHEDIVNVAYKPHTDTFEVTFYVHGDTLASALNLVNSNINFKLNSIAVEEELQVVTSYAKGQEVTLVPETEFQKLDSEIQILSNNVLVNNRTGVKAILIPDQSLALVGNEIIKSETLSVKSPKDNLTYYNLEVLKVLMSNGYLSTFGDNSFYKHANLSDEYVALHSSRGTELSKAMVNIFNYSELVPNDMGEQILVRQEEVFVNTAQLQSISNSYIREFTKIDSKNNPVTVKFMLDLDFYIPEHTDITPPNAIITVDSMNEYIFTRPSESETELRDYWDMNYTLSNALMNGMMETTGVEYIKTGYVIPSITILYYSNKMKSEGMTELTYDYVSMREVVSDFLQGIGEEFPKEFIERFLGDTSLYNRRITTKEAKTNQLISPIMDGENVVGYKLKNNLMGEYYPNKSLAIEFYPMWVHALFNNYSQEDIGSNLSMNSNLWRSISIGRHFKSIAMTENQKNAMIFNGAGEVYAIPSNNAVYELLTQTDLKMIDDKVVMPTRQSFSNLTKNIIGQEVTYNDDTYYVTSLDNNYYVLVDTEPIQINLSDQNNLIEMAHQTMITRFGKGVGNYRAIDNELPTKYYEGDVAVLNKTEKSNKVSFYKDGQLTEIKEVESLKDQFVSYYPVFRLNTLFFKIGENKELIRSDTSIAHIMNDFYTGILSRTYIDSLILETGEVSPLEEIEIGSKIQVGDINIYKVEDNKYITEPIKVLSDLTSPIMKDGAITKDSLATFAVTSLNFPIQTENGIQSFVNYIDSLLLAPKREDLALDYDGTAVRNVTSGKTYNATGEGMSLFTLDNLMKSVSIELSFTEGLSAVKSDTDKSYSLIFSSVQSGGGKYGSTPIITSSIERLFEPETLDEINSPKFLAIPVADFMHEEFLDNYQHEKFLAVSRILGLLFILLLVYRSIIPTMILSSKDTGLFRYILEIMMPYESGKGIDWIKVFTLGSLDKNLDTPWSSMITQFIAHTLLAAIAISILRQVGIL